MATTTVETTTIIRPLKVIAFVCGIISIILLIVAIASTAWLEAENYRQGLWEECFDTEDSGSTCRANEDKDWIVACGALCIIGLLVDVAAVVCNGLGLFLKTQSKKKTFYRIAMYLLFFTVLCVVIALIVFPAMFMQEIDDRGPEYTEWYFAWAYGVAWGAAIFIFGAAVLLLIDKDTEEVAYKEKTYYHDTDA